MILNKIPIRAMVASGFCIGSSSMNLYRRSEAKLSLRVSLMREPLKPTRETPIMTVMRDAHLKKKKRRMI